MRIDKMEDLIGRAVRLVKPTRAKVIDGGPDRPAFPVGSVGMVMNVDTKAETFGVVFRDATGQDHGITGLRSDYFEVVSEKMGDSRNPHMRYKSFPKGRGCPESDD